MAYLFCRQANLTCHRCHCLSYLIISHSATGSLPLCHTSCTVSSSTTHERCARRSTRSGYFEFHGLLIDHCLDPGCSCHVEPGWLRMLVFSLHRIRNSSKRAYNSCTFDSHLCLLQSQRLCPLVSSLCHLRSGRVSTICRHYPDVA
jgi:hypothetical protein